MMDVEQKELPLLSIYIKYIKSRVNYRKRLRKDTHTHTHKQTCQESNQVVVVAVIFCDRGRWMNTWKPPPQLRLRQQRIPPHAQTAPRGDDDYDDNVPIHRCEIPSFYGIRVMPMTTTPATTMVIVKNGKLLLLLLPSHRRYPGAIGSFI